MTFQMHVSTVVTALWVLVSQWLWLTLAMALDSHRCWSESTFSQSVIA